MYIYDVTEIFHMIKKYYTPYNSHAKQRENMKKSNITVTHHSWQRCCERSSMGALGNKQFKDLAYMARYNGLELKSLRKSDFTYSGLSELYECFQKNFHYYQNSNRIRWYEDLIFVFAGKKGRTLKTVIKIDETYKS